jgi:hypothetical protein
MWCLTRSVEMTQKPREGLAGIYYLLISSAKSAKNTRTHAKPGGIPFGFQTIAETLSYQSRREETCVSGYTQYHRIEILSLDQLLEKFTLEAIFKKEITKSINTRDITNMILTFFSGYCGRTHQSPSPLKMFFRRNIDLLLRGLA